MKGKKANRIATTLVFWLVIVSSILTLIGTTLELYIDYRGHLNRISQRVGRVAENQLPDIQRFISEGDTEAVSYVLKQLLGSASVAYAAVVLGNQIAWEEGDRKGSYKIVSSQPFWINQQKEPDAAVLKVGTDTAPLREYIRKKIVHSLIGNGVKIFILGTFVFLMVQFLVTRHLEEIARQVKEQDITKPSEPIRLDRSERHKGDELDQVVADLNNMRHKAREALELLSKNEERLLLFFDSTDEVIVGVERDGSCSFVNDSCMEMLGILNIEEALGQPLTALFSHYDLTTQHTSWGNRIIDVSLERGSAQYCPNGYLALASKKLIPVSLKSYPLYQEGEVSGAVLIIRDNSEKRELLHERELLSQALEQSPVMIVIADHQSKIEYVNPGTVRWSGYSKEELLGNSLFSFVKISREAEITVVELEEKLQRGQKWEGVIRTNSKWGATVSLYCIISPVFDESNTIVNTIAVCKEVSYEAALQDELLNSKKMEAVGRLSSRFAHEFGNPLFGVRALLKDLSERLELSAEDNNLLQLARLECDKMRGLVQEFQEVYLESTRDDVLVGVDTVLHGVLTELDLLLTSEQISCEVELDENLAGLLVSKNRLTLVVRNIVMNSMDSMNHRDGFLKIEGGREGDFIHLCICDNGCGIRTDLQELVFEPFFSTKAEVEGAGLGLSVAYGTMKNIGGTITFSSVPGKGACFSVYIPVKESSSQLQ